MELEVFNKIEWIGLGVVLLYALVLIFIHIAHAIKRKFEKWD